MKIPKTYLPSILLLIGILLCGCSKNNGGEDPGDPGDPGEPESPGVVYEGHPRILLFKGEEEAVRQFALGDNTWKRIHNTILGESDKLQSQPLLIRQLTGKRLLSVSREALRRLFFLSYSYRMTGDRKYLNRASSEIENISGFSDWNPSHFLDVAEMTMALAIGYDWLYDDLMPEVRQKAHAALRDKGLKPSLDASLNKGFLNAKTNWSQVCHGGLAFGALALLKEEPELAQQILDRSASKMTIPMAEYGPDGAYPEGPGYWEYGTSFNALYLAAVEKYFETDYGLGAAPGFMQTGIYSQQVITPQLYSFSYADNNSGTSLSSTVLWFYSKTTDPTLLYNQKMMMDANKNMKSDRILPAAILWGAASNAPLHDPQIPAELFYLAGGPSPICVMRSAWDDPEALYVGFKAGTPKVNHGHMDVGSFIFEADGVRWGIDLGSENYTTIEEHITGLFSMAQTSARWDVFRYNNWAHSTLTFNDGRKQQLVDGKAEFRSWSDAPQKMFAVSDLTPVYSDAVAKVERGVAMVDKSYAMVEDVITTKAGADTKVRWNMTSGVTNAQLDQANQTIVMTKGEKKLYVKVVADVPVTLKTWPTAPTTSYENANTGTLFVGFETTLPAGAASRLKVYLMPGAPVPNPLDKIID